MENNFPSAQVLSPRRGETRSRLLFNSFITHWLIFCAHYLPQQVTLTRQSVAKQRLHINQRDTTSLCAAERNLYTTALCTYTQSEYAARRYDQSISLFIHAASRRELLSPFKSLSYRSARAFYFRRLAATFFSPVHSARAPQ